MSYTNADEVTDARDLPLDVPFLVTVPAAEQVVADDELDHDATRRLMGAITRELLTGSPAVTLRKREALQLVDAAERGLNLDTTFELRWAEQMRALALWRMGNRDRDRLVPGLGDLLLFLLQKLDTAEIDVAKATDELKRIRKEAGNGRTREG